MENNDMQDVQPEENEQEVANPEVAELKSKLEEQEKQIADLARAKRELKKEAKKADATESKDSIKSDDSNLLQKFDKLALKTEGITEADEIELAERLKEETGKDMEDLLTSKYFKTELEAIREEKANIEATTGVKGKSGKSSEAKSTTEYWQAKGMPPTPEQVPDKNTRRKIVREMLAKADEGGAKFYNE